jgi:hypothetical protein
LIDCPDPRLFFDQADIKVAKKLSTVYREADAVQVFNDQGDLIEVDDLPESVYAGCAVVGSISLN